MKATFLTIAITFLLSANIFAAEPMKYTNEFVTDFGKQQELTIFQNDTPTTPVKRIVNNYDYQGNLTERITFDWVAFEGWIPATKIEYSYNEFCEIASMAHIQWNQSRKEWNNKQEQIALYNTSANNNSMFLVEKQ